jgi:hypothetical protein
LGWDLGAGCGGRTWHILFLIKSVFGNEPLSF